MTKQKPRPKELAIRETMTPGCFNITVASEDARQFVLTLKEFGILRELSHKENLYQLQAS